MESGSHQASRTILAAVVLALISSVPSVLADTVTPTARAVHGVVVRARASVDSDRVGALSPGESAELIETTGAWRKVQLGNGTTGFVSSAWTEVELATGLTQGPETAPTHPPNLPAPHGPGTLTFRPVSTVAMVPHAAPGEHAYRIHLIDVGTGLSVLVQGHDFNLLFDGGSNDDFAGISGGHDADRLIAYLFAALGPSGPPDCVPDGDPPPPHPDNPKLPIQHVFLSHPHRDHGAFLNDVLHCYAVENVWDSGAVNDTGFYKNFVQAIADEPNVSYHTAAAIPPSRTIVFDHSGVVMPSSVSWTTFAEGEHETLDTGARFTVLHVDPTLAPAGATPDYNFNSIVLRLELGGRSLLLTGDTTNGRRQPHTTAPLGAEAALLAHHSPELRADILQVAHHGSDTSTRDAFLMAVAPELALVGSGPKKYGSVVLPDQDVVDALEAVGAHVLRTDDSDKIGCVASDRIGRDDDSPGGCDNWVIELFP
jgi:competence protein ComEC